MKDKLGYIKELMLNYYDENQNNSQNENIYINEDNVIDSNDVNNNFEYNQSSQEISNDENFDYTLLKVIIFLIFV